MFYEDHMCDQILKAQELYKNYLLVKKKQVSFVCFFILFALFFLSHTQWCSEPTSGSVFRNHS